MQSSPWRVKGGRTVINRFLEARRVAAREVQQWHRRSFCYTYACLELDMYKGAKFNKIAATKLDVDDGPSTSAGKQTFRSEKNIRAACSNVMVLTSLIYADKSILARQKIFVSASGPLDEWHHLQSVSTRSVSDTRAFLVDQLGHHGFLFTMEKILRVLESHQEMAYVGFTVPEEAFPRCAV